MANCQVPVSSRRKLFWSTQPGGCSTTTECGYECGIPGLAFTEARLYDCASCQCCPPATVDPSCPDHGATQRGIMTDEWLRGLAINMLMTDGLQPDSPCGFRPGSQGGHWSSSYIENGPSDVGTLIRSIPSTGRIQDSVALVTSYAQATLARMVTRGVALAVDVVGTYLGGGRMKLDVTISGRNGEQARVGINGARASNGWMWQ